MNIFKKGNQVFPNLIGPYASEAEGAAAAVSKEGEEGEEEEEEWAREVGGEPGKCSVWTWGGRKDKNI